MSFKRMLEKPPNIYIDLLSEMKWSEFTLFYYIGDKSYRAVSVCTMENKSPAVTPIKDSLLIQHCTQLRHNVYDSGTCKITKGSL